MVNTITVNSPNGGENWAKGTTKTITWSKTGSLGPKVKIELYKAGVFKKQIVYDTPNDGSYSWIVPSDLVVASDYKIKIIGCVGTATGCNSPIVYVIDTSNNNFQISLANAIMVAIPSATGISWQRGTSKSITWTATGLAAGGNVKIELLKAGVLNLVIATSTPNDGSYTWAIPGVQVVGTTYKIRITKLTTTYTDTSDNNFSITSTVAPSIKVNSPSATGISWAKNSSHAITWTAVGITGNVKIHLFKGGIWKKTLTSVPLASAGTWTWVIPAGATDIPVVGTDYKIKVARAEAAGVPETVYDFSDNNFTITVATTCNKPVSNFTHVVDHATKQVTFTDTSTYSPASWDWDFGDSSTHGTTQSPIHTYAGYGTYTVTLKASNSCGAGVTVTKTVTITEPARPEADWAWLAYGAIGLAGVYVIYRVLSGDEEETEDKLKKNDIFLEDRAADPNQAVVDRLERERLARERLVEDQLALDRQERERLAKGREEEDVLERERLAKEREEIDRLEREHIAQPEERERLEKERTERLQKLAEDQEKLAREQAILQYQKERLA